WLHFCAHERLWGLTLFGRPDRADAVEMTRAFEVELDEAVPPHGCFVDARPLEGIDPGAFETLQEFAGRNLDRSRAHVSRLALCLAACGWGAGWAGFYGVLGSPYQIETFTDGDAGLAWLDERRDSVIGAEIEAALAEARGTSPLVGALRGWLRQSFASP